MDFAQQSYDKSQNKRWFYIQIHAWALRWREYQQIVFRIHHHLRSQLTGLQVQGGLEFHPAVEEHEAHVFWSLGM